MLHWLLGILGAGFVWLAVEFLCEVVVGATWFASGPLRRPVWNAFVTASWPWPLGMMMLVGAGIALLGWRELQPELAGWRNVVGLVAFLGGCGVALFAPFAWRDARREHRDVMGPDQPSNDR